MRDSYISILFNNWSCLSRDLPVLSILQTSGNCMKRKHKLQRWGQLDRCHNTKPLLLQTILSVQKTKRKWWRQSPRYFHFYKWQILGFFSILFCTLLISSVTHTDLLTCVISAHTIYKHWCVLLHLAVLRHVYTYKRKLHIYAFAEIHKKTHTHICI